MSALKPSGPAASFEVYTLASTTLACLKRTRRQWQGEFNKATDLMELDPREVQMWAAKLCTVKRAHNDMLVWFDGRWDGPTTYPEVLTHVLIHRSAIEDGLLEDTGEPTISFLDGWLASKAKYGKLESKKEFEGWTFFT